MKAASQYPVLIRHFFGRFFDKESLSPQGDPQANVVQTLALFATPEACAVLILLPLTIRGWDLVTFRYFFVSFSMIVMGFIAVFEWDALFPDLRDYQILTPLPLRASTLFLAQAAAYFLFLGIFLLDVNLLGALFWPAIDVGSSGLAVIGAHLVSVIGGGLFAALAAAAVQGALALLLPGPAFRRASVAIRTLLIATLAAAFFLSSFLAGRLRPLVHDGGWFLYCFPPYWFVGLYESLIPATHDPALAALGRLGWYGLAGAAALFALTYLPGYRCHARKTIEAPSGGLAAPRVAARAVSSILDRTLLRRPVERAVFHFITQTILRSAKHRLFLAVYAGFGAALAVMNLGPGRWQRALPLTLSFVLVSGLRAAFNFPSELRANWTFLIHESGGLAECLSATRKWIVVCAVVPLFLGLAPWEFAYSSWSGALFRVAFPLALTLLLVEVMFFGFRKIPFACARFPGRANAVGLGVIYILGFTVYTDAMTGLERLLESEPLWAALFLAAVAAALVLLARWRRRRFGPNPELAYEDPSNPAVMTLGLTEQ